MTESDVSILSLTQQRDALKIEVEDANGRYWESLGLVEYKDQKIAALEAQRDALKALVLELLDAYYAAPNTWPDLHQRALALAEGQ